MCAKCGEHLCVIPYIGVRDLPERDIWSLRVGWGVGNPCFFRRRRRRRRPWLGPPKRGL